MTGLDKFETFKVTIPDNRRYWEDESTGVSIKRGQIVEIGPRQFRSAELRFAMIRSQVLVVEGKAVFAFRENMVTITPGKGANAIVSKNINSNEVTSNEPKKDIPKDIPKKEEPVQPKKVPVQTKKAIDDIPDLEEDV
jgi:hypothetical protein